MASAPILRIFILQPSSGVPIYLQLIQQVRRMVASGQLTPGTEMPSPFSRYWLSAGQDTAGADGNIAEADLRNPFTGPEMTGIRSALEQLQPEFDAKGAASEYGYMMDRLSLLESAS